MPAMVALVVSAGDGGGVPTVVLMGVMDAVMEVNDASDGGTGGESAGDGGGVPTVVLMAVVVAVTAALMKAVVVMVEMMWLRR